MATVTTARRRQSSLLDPEPPPPGGFTRPAARPAGARVTSGAAVAPPAAAPAPRRQSLDDVVTATWESLAASHVAACPLCGGDLPPRYSAGARPVGGRCRSCGTEIA